ncbi:DMT family transporter [Agrococcus sp. KRD186]|jgi:quaternary ammonium compound-resistance protein SugE|uniref:DMT family transporter n=1 Tax=Agrococcus sp. KRD186 TaxID=2729730 RepID=UPI0019D08261|nr:multidrug efflux SMR transporter [Agrococcus sp. KRD186]
MRPRTAWIVLFASAVLEAVWATALGQSEGFTRLAPSIVFVVAGIASFIGLERAVRVIPLATGYAVWTGVGGALTVLWALATGAQPFNPLMLLFLAGILVAVAGLALTERAEPASPAEAAEPASPAEPAQPDTPADPA